MKQILIALSLMFSLNSLASPIVLLVSASSSAPATSFLCARESSGVIDCAPAITTGLVGVSIGIALLKEMQEARLDALNYSSTGESTPALVSVVEKVQQVAFEQNVGLDFDKVVDLINTL